MRLPRLLQWLCRYGGQRKKVLNATAKLNGEREKTEHATETMRASLAETIAETLAETRRERQNRG